MINILYTVITGFFTSMASCFILDNIFKKTIKENAQYFLLHVCLNSYIVYMTSGEALEFFTSPLIDFSVYTESSVKSASVCIGFHMYHYFTATLDFETKVHHIVTVFMTGSTALLIPSGTTTSAINFIMCGLPGGIDYILLVLFKYGVINTLLEKNINRWLNLLIRMPGMMLVFWYIFLNLYSGNIIWYDYILMITSSLIMTVNAIYYCNKTVGNFHVRRYCKLIEPNKAN
jgi:hypothetical protein